MSTAAELAEVQDQLNLSKDQAKIYFLTLDLLKLDKDKKATVAGFNEEIKRIKAEIKAIANHEDDDEPEVPEA